MLFGLLLTFVAPFIAAFFRAHIFALSLGVGLIALDPLSLAVLGAFAIETRVPPDVVLNHAARLQWFTWLGLGFLAIAAALFALRARLQHLRTKLALAAMYLGILSGAAASVIIVRAWFDPDSGNLPVWAGPGANAGLGLAALGAIALAVFMVRGWRQRRDDPAP